MRAYLKIALVLALAILIDRFALAPHRLMAAMEREASEDWPHCSCETNGRMLQLRDEYASLGDPRSVGECWKLAADEHLRLCPRSHLADEMNRRRAQPEPDRSRYARLLHKIRWLEAFG